MERHGNVDLEELGVLLGVSGAEVANEVATLEKEGIICGYHTVINWDSAGVDKVNALIEVRVTPQRNEGFDKIARRISNYREVSSVYLISGAFDLLITIEGKTLLEVSRFVSERLSPLEDIVSTSTHFILKKYKDFGTCMEVPNKDERMLVTP
nr:Lrp/AsnC family transcriptional regulator [Ohessyouella blattaphilus]